MRSHVASLVASLVACSGGGNDTPADKPDTGQVTVDSGVDGATDTNVDSSVPLDGLCPSLIDATCGAEAKACCTNSGVTFQETGCRDLWTSVCKSQVDAVKAGKATYVPSALPSCLSAWKAAWTKCTITYVERQRLIGVCGGVYVGNVEMGGDCKAAAECKPPAGAAGYCSGGSCGAVGVQETEGASCATYTACGEGLYCAYLDGSVCKKALPLGASCTTDDPQICGRGAVCSGGKCITGKPGGESCADGFECASWDCRLSKCVPMPAPMADTVWCSGT